MRLSLARWPGAGIHHDAHHSDSADSVVLGPALSGILAGPRSGLPFTGRTASASVSAAGSASSGRSSSAERSGDLVSLVTADVETVESFFAHTIAPGFVAIMVPGTVLAVLAYFAWPLAIVLVPFLLAVGLSPFIASRVQERLGPEYRGQLGVVNAQMVDSVQGLKEYRWPFRVDHGNWRPFVTMARR